MAADWTVMVYLAGDNNLTVESLYSLTEMKRVKQDDRIHVIAQFDPEDDYLPTRRFVITKTSAQGHLLDDSVDKAPFQKKSSRTIRRKEASLRALAAGQQAIAEEAEAALGSGVFPAMLKPTVVKNLGLQLLGTAIDSNSFPTDTDTDTNTETNTGSPDTLYDFLSFCLEKYPAKHYLVILSGHGSGTEQDFLMKDESPADSLTIQELRQVFEDLGQTIDILGFNSCLMSMAEVCYELKGLVKIMIGSESYSPATGWPLYQVLDSGENWLRKALKTE